MASLVEDQAIRELLFSFMDQPILLKKDGMDVSPKKGIPIVPVLTEFMEFLYLNDIDRQLERHFRSCVRWNDQLIIPCFPDQFMKKKDDDDNVLNRLKNIVVEWGTAVSVMLMVPGGHPVEFKAGIIILTNEKRKKYFAKARRAK